MNDNEIETLDRNLEVPWNPHNETHGINEEIAIDSKGHVVERGDMMTIALDDAGE